MIQEPSVRPLGALVLEATLTNYTPLMLGDYATATLRKTTHGTVSLADATKQIIGKARWLLRTIIATAGCASNHREAEAWPRITIKHKNNDKPIVKNLGLVQLAYGSSRPSWKALYTIQTKLTLDPQPEDQVYKNRKSKITRYSLMTRKGGQEKELKTPIAPEKAHLQLRIIRRLNPQTGNLVIQTDDSKQIDIDVLDKLIAITTLAVPRILGIGAGANRGFGRFQVDNSVIGTGMTNDMKNLFNSLDEVDYSDDVKKLLINLFYKLNKLTLQSVSLNTCNNSKINKIKLGIIYTNKIRVYSINELIINNIIEKLSQPLQQTPSIVLSLQGLRGIHQTIEAIALVTLKISWKLLNQEGYFGGGAYHTWILGLPRRQKVNFNHMCFDIGNIEKENEKKEKPSLPSGYILKSEKLPESWKKMKKLKLKRINNDNNNYLLYTLFNEIINDRNKVDNSSIDAYVEGRRQSPFIMFPLNKNGSLVALIPLYPYDLSDIIGVMYHSGGLVDRESIGSEKVIFTNIVRLAGVQDIASGNVGKAIKQCDDGKVFVNDKVSGVAKPNTRTHPPNSEASFNAGGLTDSPVSPDQLLEEVYNAALEFIDELLS